jgi:hypothetical protein
VARIYANENFPLPVVRELRRLGHDVLTIQETGKAGQAVPDEAVLSFAVAQRIDDAMKGTGILTGKLVRVNRPLA